MAAIMVTLAATGSLAGQTLSARPASVSLTVVVPSPLRSGDALIAERPATVLHRSPTMLDLEAEVGLPDRPASRIEVRLGAAWPADSARVLVRNRNGDFEPLANDAAVVATDAPPSHTRPRAAVHFRVVSASTVPPAMAIPVQYRITVGRSDQIATWSFPSFLRVETAR